MLAPIIVFDLDGTLIDTAPDLIDTLNQVLAQEGVPAIDFDRARPLIGAGIRPLLERTLAEQWVAADGAMVDALFARYLRLYGAHIADRSQPYPGVVEALDRLASQGFLLAVCTNKYEGLSVQLLKALGLAQRFAAICGQDTFPVKKPHPEALLQTIGRAQGDPGRAVMVGDSETDIRVARAAGVPVIGVDFGYTPIPMTELAPNRLIGHFDALPEAALELVPATTSAAQAARLS
jgi:phosphoglycolate phosphatase